LYLLTEGTTLWQDRQHRVAVEVSQHRKQNLIVNQAENQCAAKLKALLVVERLQRQKGAARNADGLVKLAANVALAAEHHHLLHEKPLRKKVLLKEAKSREEEKTQARREKKVKNHRAL
jgi:hypothetical protein